MVCTENVRFNWDPGKAKAKHRVSFELAITVFDDPSALIADDEKHSSSLEQRHWIIGMSDSGVLLVVYTVRQSGSVCRIISARRAKRKERRRYEEFKRLSL